MAARSRQASLPGMEPDDAPVVSGCAPQAANGASAAASSPAGNADGSLPRSGEVVYVVDSNSLIFQVFHAIPEMSSPRGEPVNAVFGFARDMLFLLDNKRPDYLFAAFDLAGPTFRHELYPAYKGQRAECPEELSPQFPKIERMLDCLGIPVLTCEAFEADDILATVARLSEERGADCYLVTGDKDCRQLIGDRVKVYNVRKDAAMDIAGLAAEWGVRPEQVVDYQSLVGDSVDNIPGIPQIGPKTARELLEKYGTLEEVLAHASEVTGAKRRQNLMEGGPQALLSRQLVRLDPHVPIPIDWTAARPGRMDRAALWELFSELGFRSLSQRFRAGSPGPRGPAEMGADSPAGTRPAATGRANEATPSGPRPSSADPRPAAPPNVNYRLVATPEAFAAFLAELTRQRRISIDTETTHINATWADLVGLSLSWRAGEGYYLPVRAPEGEPRLDEAMTMAALREVLENPAVEKVGQNLKYDQLVFRGCGIELRGATFDTMIASYLLNAGERNHNLDELAYKYLEHTTTKIEELIGTGSKQKRMDEVPLSQICHYAAEDADIPWRLAPLLGEQLAEIGLDGLFRDLEMPLIDVLVEMEHNGIRVDRDRLTALSGEYGERIAALEGEIYALAGREFNIASPKQLQQILFDELRLPVVKRTATGPSTDADVLEELAAKHPLPAKIVEYRQFAKLKNTYVDALPEMINPRTGRVHASFNQVVAATGRLSCNNPNLQNIPVRTREGREIRSAFLPGKEGWLLLAADYSQIELRVLAHFCGDEELRAAFARDEDIHTRVAAQVNNVSLEDVTPAMRRQAKAVNFGVIYGQSAFGLARGLGIEKSAAAEFIRAYFERYRGVDEFLSKVLADCRRQGYVSTILGRRRAIRGVREGARGGMNLPERTAVNTVIQGSAADLIKKSMIAVYRRLRHEKLAARMLLQVHDELIFEVPPTEVDAVARMVSEEMSGVMELSVPLKVDVAAGPNWAEVEPLEQSQASLRSRATGRRIAMLNGRGPFNR